MGHIAHERKGVDRESFTAAFVCVMSEVSDLNSTEGTFFLP